MRGIRGEREWRRSSDEYLLQLVDIVGDRGERAELGPVKVPQAVEVLRDPASGEPLPPQLGLVIERILKREARGTGSRGHSSHPQWRIDAEGERPRGLDPSNPSPRTRTPLRRSCRRRSPRGARTGAPRGSIRARAKGDRPGRPRRGGARWASRGRPPSCEIGDRRGTGHAHSSPSSPPRRIPRAGSPRPPVPRPPVDPRRHEDLPGARRAGDRSREHPGRRGGCRDPPRRTPQFPGRLPGMRSDPRARPHPRGASPPLRSRGPGAPGMEDRRALVHADGGLPGVPTRTTGPVTVDRGPRPRGAPTP